MGQMRAVPEAYCRHYHEQKTIKRTWLNGYGVLIDWPKEMVKWWNSDRHKWVGGKPPGAGRIDLEALEYAIGTHRANPEWVGYDAKAVTQALRDELDSLKKKRKEALGGGK